MNIIKIGIINYGMGNIASVSNAIRFVGFEPVIINSPQEIISCDKIILPGVGAYAQAMHNLLDLNFTDALHENVLINRKMILGLCLGMQLFFENSEEHGDNKGLSWIKGQVKNLKNKVDLIVPHMGWNRLEKQNSPKLLIGIPEDELDYYFVHSYYCDCENKSESVAIVNYGVKMDVMVQKENIFGCQFHPEKSQKSGLELLKNFCKM
jgi:glutamine amidotransferase